MTELGRFNHIAAIALSAMFVGWGLPASAADEALPEGSQAAEGRHVYVAHCAQCHGDRGQGFIGPMLIGAEALLRYDTAARLYEFTSTTMPQTNPGGLTAEQYLEVVAYLLVENDFIEADATLKPGALGDIDLEHK